MIDVQVLFFTNSNIILGNFMAYRECGACDCLVLIYTELNYKRKTFVFVPIFHELNLKI